MTGVRPKLFPENVKIPAFVGAVCARVAGTGNGEGPTTGSSAYTVDTVGAAYDMKTGVESLPSRTTVTGTRLPSPTGTKHVTLYCARPKPYKLNSIAPTAGVATTSPVTGSMTGHVDEPTVTSSEAVVSKCKHESTSLLPPATPQQYK